MSKLTNETLKEIVRSSNQSETARILADEMLRIRGVLRIIIAILEDCDNIAPKLLVLGIRKNIDNIYKE